MKFTDRVYRDIKSYAKQSNPSECCGFVISSENLFWTTQRVLPIANRDPNPKHQVTVNPSDIASVQAQGEIVAFYHSHTGFDCEFSTLDRYKQQTLLPYTWILYCVKTDRFIVEPMAGEAE